MKTFLQQHFSKLGLMLTASLLGIIFWIASFFPFIHLKYISPEGGPLAVVLLFYLSIPALIFNLIFINILFWRMYKNSKIAEWLFYFFIACVLILNIINGWTFVAGF